MSDNNKLSGMENQPEKHSASHSKSFHVFLKTGGEQPTEVDVKKINNYFEGNYSKSWAMGKGFISTFRELKNKKVIFDMTTDPRFSGDYSSLSRWIAKQYKNKVDVLAAATSFQANHFIASEQIGFLISADADKSEIDNLIKICRRANASLPAEPTFLHTGKIS